MKRILSLALLFLFLFNVAGYYFLFLMLVPANRNEMRNTLLQHTSLETIRIHKSKLHTVSFKDGGREILYHGEMYDVKSRSEKGDYILSQHFESRRHHFISHRYCMGSWL